MPYLSDINITNRIVPALITLSNDSNRFDYLLNNNFKKIIEDIVFIKCIISVMSK